MFKVNFGGDPKHKFTKNRQFITPVSLLALQYRDIIRPVRLMAGSFTGFSCGFLQTGHVLREFILGYSIC